MDTIHARAPVRVPADLQGADPAAADAFARRGWEPLTAWRLQSLYGPTVQAIRSLTATDVPRTAAAANRCVRVLQVGGQPGVLQHLLDAGVAPVACEVMLAAPAGDRLPVPDASVDCAVAIDWLPGLAASQRERAVADLCRVSRVGVVIVSAFDSPAVRAASRAVNELHRAVRGEDHPWLGRPLEVGFPDACVVQAWLEEVFPIVSARSVGDAAAWQMCEALTMTRGAPEGEPSNADIAAAALYPATDTTTDRDHAYRMMLTAARASRRTSFVVPDGAGGAVTNGAAIALHQAVEAAAHRRSIDALTHAITTERDREREDFRATVASLAEELRDLDARAEHLAREVRTRDHSLANVQLMLTGEQQRAGALAAQAAHLTEAAQAAEAVVATAQAVQNAQTQHAAELAAATGQIAELRARLSAAERAAAAFATSRAGRALRRYTRLKNFVLRRR